MRSVLIVNKARAVLGLWSSRCLLAGGGGSNHSSGQASRSAVATSLLRPEQKEGLLRSRQGSARKEGRELAGTDNLWLAQTQLCAAGVFAHGGDTHWIGPIPLWVWAKDRAT